MSDLAAIREDDRTHPAYTAFVIGQMVRHIMASSGITFSSLIHAGCDELDLEPIRQALELRPARRNG